MLSSPAFKTEGLFKQQLQFSIWKNVWLINKLTCLSRKIANHMSSVFIHHILHNFNSSQNEKKKKEQNTNLAFTEMFT